MFYTKPTAIIDGHTGKDISNTPGIDFIKMMEEELGKDPKITHIKTAPDVVAVDVINGNKDYSFTLNENIKKYMNILEALSSPDLSERLRACCYSRKDDRLAISYLTIRDEVGAINLLLNKRKHFAPYFRPMLKPPRLGKAYTEEDKLLSNDRQVIDLHWLWEYAKGTSINGPTGYKGLCSAENFDWALASKFVEKIGKTKLKAVLLGLSEFEQLTLFSIQDTQTRDRWNTIKKAQKEALKKFRSAALSAKSKITKETLDTLLNIYLSLRLSRGSPSKASEIYYLMTATEINERVVARRKEWFNKHKINIT